MSSATLGFRIESFFTERYRGWDGVEQFKGTGARLERMVEELCWPPEKIKIELEKCFKAVFPDKHDEMLIHGPTLVWTLCPHHLVPCSFRVHIGYIPDKGVLGLSKFSRVSMILAKRPIMQETYTRDIADAIMKNLHPKGVGVHVLGHHGCMGCRGVLQEDVGVVTSVLRGYFLTDPSAKSEFLNSIR